MKMRDVVAVILGGGEGSELYPLTRDRTVPAIPLAGKYRLVDIPMSNCFHAGIDKIAILTQFNSASLHRHLQKTYTRDIFSRGWIQILAAEQTPESGEWYQGTADAVRKQMLNLQTAGSEYTLILSGDHLYLMDYRRFLQFHVDSQADITLAVCPVSRVDAKTLGVLTMDGAGIITEFQEKPQNNGRLEHFVSRDDPERPFMASMGVYIFTTKKLVDILSINQGVDFGRHIIPEAIRSYRTVGYRFNDYWEDIGTLHRFFEANLDLAAPLPKFNLYDPQRPIFTYPRFLPGSKVEAGNLHNVLLADGCRIQEATIRNSVMGLRSIVRAGTTIHRCIMMGADFYEAEEEREKNRDQGRPHIGVGAHSVIEGAIIDKNARIGRGVTIRYNPDRPDEEHEHWVARDGIVVVPKNAIIPDGAII
jgi:glucose-1-phosphate adenylyltransferase